MMTSSSSVPDSRLAALLLDLQNPDNMARKRAESEWAPLVHLPGIVGGLLRCIRDSKSTSMSLMALVLLKNNITAFDRRDAIVELVGEDGKSSPVLQLLVDCNEPRVSRLVAGLVVRIASLKDGPWEQLYVCLESMIRSDPNTPNGPSHLFNALQTLSVLAASLSSDVLGAFSPLVPSILPIALNAGSTSTSAVVSPASVALQNNNNSPTPTNGHVYPPDSQRLALRVLAEMCLVLGVVGEESQSELAAGCCNALRDITSIGCLPLSDDATFNGIPHEAMKLASVVANFSPAQLDRQILECLLASLVDSAPRFTAIMERGTDAELESSAIQVSSSRFDLLQKFCFSSKRSTTQREANAAANAILNSEGAAMQLFELVMSYSLVSTHTADGWVSDANAFLKAESEREDQVSSDTRDVAVEALMDAVKLFGSEYANGVWMMCIQRVQATSSDASRWKEAEAALFIASQLLCRRIKVLRGVPAALESITPFCEHIATDILNSSSGANPCLLLRALAFLTTVVQSCKKDINVRPMVQQLIVPCAQTLSSTSSASIVAASSRLLQKMVPVADKGVITDGITTATLGAILTSCFIKDIPSELLYSLLELCLLWIKQLHKHRVPPTCVQDLPRSLMDVWRAHLEDPNVSELIVDALLVLVQGYPNTHASFLSTSPWIASTLRGQESMAALCAIPSLLAVLRRLLRIGDESLLTDVGNTLLGPLCQLLLVNDDTGVLGLASLTLGTMLCRLGASVFSCSVEVPASHLQAPSEDAMPLLDEVDVSAPFPVVVECIAAKVLSSSRSELALMNTGGFLSTLVPVVSQAPTNYSNFLSALSQRCLSVRMDSSLQELLVPLCRSIIDDTPRALEVLHQHHHDGSSSSILISVMERWLPLIPQMYGRVLMMRTAQALTAMTGFFCSAGGEAAGMFPFTWRVGDVGSAKYKKGSNTVTGLTLGTAVFLALAKLLVRATRQQKSPDFVSNRKFIFSGYEEDVYSGLHEDVLGGDDDGDDDDLSYDSDDDDEEEEDEEEDKEGSDDGGGDDTNQGGNEGLRGEIVECFEKVKQVMQSPIVQRVGGSGYLTANELKWLQKRLV